MRNYHYFSMLALLFLISTPAAAEIRNLTLEQALATALESNRDIEKAREYANYVQGKYVEERSAALPQLSLNGSYAVSKDESQQFSTLAAQRLSNSFIDVSLTQPLYTWGKVNAAIRAAEVGMKTAEQQLRLYQQAARRDVSTAWYNILLAKELNRFARENLAQKQRLLDEARNKFAAGVATDYDVLAAEVAVENARPEVIRTDNLIRVSGERLRFLLALPDEVDAVGSLAQDAAIRTIPDTYDHALEVARTKRPELLDQRFRIGIYSELVTIAAAGDKPRLDLKGAAGWRWLTLNDPGPRSEMNGSLWNLGVYLTFPFFDGLKTSGQVTQAKSDLRTKQIEELKLLDSIALEVLDTVNALREADEICKAIAGTVRQAEKLLQMAEKGFEYGVKIRLEVDDAQLNLLQATISLARAQRDYMVAKVNYEWAMGTLGE